jgi:hypothetical protein
MMDACGVFPQTKRTLTKTALLITFAHQLPTEPAFQRLD